MRHFKVVPDEGMTVCVIDLDQDSDVKPVYLLLSDHVPEIRWRWVVISMRAGKLDVTPGEILGATKNSVQYIPKADSPTIYLAAVMLRAGQKEINPTPNRQDILDMRILNRTDPARDGAGAGRGRGWEDDRMDGRVL